MSLTCVTDVIKVFRLQRKTLLLFFGFFFPIIIIKVFRFSRKTLKWLLCFLIVIVLFLFLYSYQGLPFPTEDLIVIVLFLFLYSSFFSYRSFAEDFSKSVGSILMKFSGLIDNHKNLIYFFILMTSLPVLRNGMFFSFRGSRCPDFSSKTKKATKLKFLCLHISCRQGHTS